jgi:hypothetical protein
VRIGFDGAEVVDGDDFDIVAGVLDDGPKDEAADPAKSVDGDAKGHGRNSCKL